MKKTKITMAILLGVAICLLSNFGFAQNISTIAGTGTAGFSGDNGPATSAKINGPFGIVKDASGNIYFADALNHRIREINLLTGGITTVAGTGTAGYSGDNGAASSAQLNWPAGLALDASGNIYIADELNQRIRKITVSTGIITTVAGNGTSGNNGDGGAATSANLREPLGVAIDASGNIFIADQNNHRIRKVTVSTGIISHFAGQANASAGFLGDGGPATSAKLHLPYSLELDASGNVYICDGENDCIRKVTVSTGIISTVAGVGTIGGYNGDGIAATSAYLYRPMDIFFNASNDLYIADYSNHRIRKVTASTGLISTVAGTGTAGYSGDNGIATSAKINQPAGIALSGSYFYFSDNANHRVRKVEICPIANAGADRTIACNGSSTLGTSSSGYTYSWSPSTYLSCTNCAQPVAHKCGGTSDQVITYTLTVTGFSCSPSTDQIVVTYDGFPSCSCNGRFANSNSNTYYNPDVIIYPNPSDGKIIIEAPEEIQSVVITDITGRVVYKGNNIASNNYSVDLSKEPKGIYLVKIIQNGKEHIEKIAIE